MKWPQEVKVINWFKKISYVGLLEHVGRDKWGKKEMALYGDGLI